MKAKAERIVLAFYRGNEGPGERVQKAIHSIADTCVVGKDSPRASLHAKWSRLRLEGEQLFCAVAASESTDDVVSALQSSDSPAIFVLRPDNPPEVPPPDALVLAGAARRSDGDVPRLDRKSI